MKKFISAVLCLFMVFGVSGNTGNCMAIENSTNETNCTIVDVISGTNNVNDIISIGVVGAVVFAAQLVISLMQNKKANVLNEAVTELMKKIKDEVISSVNKLGTKENNNTIDTNEEMA